MMWDGMGKGRDGEGEGKGRAGEGRGGRDRGVGRGKFAVLRCKPTAFLLHQSIVWADMPVKALPPDTCFAIAAKVTIVEALRRLRNKL